MSACGAGYRTEVIGHGVAIVGPAPVAAPPIAIVPGDYEIAVHFSVPRAQIVEWKVTCADATADGQLGETFDAYRQRRIAELRHDRDQKKAAIAAITGALVGAVAPPVQAQATGPGGTVTATVSPGAVAGSAVANAAVRDDIVLPPGDVGGGTLTKKIRIAAATAGDCSLTATADDAVVAGTFDVTRVHDLAAEARAADELRRAAAIDVRAHVVAQLTASGADPDLRFHLAAAAEVRASVAAEAADRRAAIVTAAANARLAAAFELRARIEGELVGWGAVAGMHARLVAERQAAAAAVRIERDAIARARLDAEQQRMTLALAARGEVRAYLVALGARERPAMPDPIEERHGGVPFVGAIWLDGHWTWSGDAWEWTKGGWNDPRTFGPSGGSAPVVAAPSAVRVEVPAVAVPGVLVVPVRVQVHAPPPARKVVHAPEPVKKR